MGLFRNEAYHDLWTSQKWETDVLKHWFCLPYSWTNHFWILIPFLENGKQHIGLKSPSGEHIFSIQIETIVHKLPTSYFEVTRVSAILLYFVQPHGTTMFANFYPTVLVIKSQLLLAFSGQNSNSPPHLQIHCQLQQPCRLCEVVLGPAAVLWHQLAPTSASDWSTLDFPIRSQGLVHGPKDFFRRPSTASALNHPRCKAWRILLLGRFATKCSGCRAWMWLVVWSADMSMRRLVVRSNATFINF